eukprot:COSAG01_NODE_1505_length_10091_cov_18.350781_1_plen_249_part_00
MLEWVGARTAGACAHFIPASRRAASAPGRHRACRLTPGPGRCVSIFLDKHRRHIGESQSARPARKDATAAAPPRASAGEGLPLRRGGTGFTSMHSQPAAPPRLYPVNLGHAGEGVSEGGTNQPLPAATPRAPRSTEARAAAAPRPPAPCVPPASHTPLTVTCFTCDHSAGPAPGQTTARTAAPRPPRPGSGTAARRPPRTYSAAHGQPVPSKPQHVGGSQSILGLDPRAAVTAVVRGVVDPHQPHTRR